MTVHFFHPLVIGPVHSNAISSSPAEHTAPATSWVHRRNDKCCEVNRVRFYNIPSVPPLHAGTRYAYYNVGYLLLGQVIEKVANRPYENVVRSMLWDVGVYRMKLGMTIRDQASLSEVINGCILLFNYL